MPLEKLGINLGSILIQIASFGILFVVLRAWVYKPLMSMMENRRRTIAQGLEDARVAAEARANAERESNQIIAEAQAKAAESFAKPRLGPKLLPVKFALQQTPKLPRPATTPWPKFNRSATVF
ncbi:MAG: hypothetical protein C0396_09785 [Anaerolinea sp.]|nr:hypothetical protein [Anaerolinea sp.]